MFTRSRTRWAAWAMAAARATATSSDDFASVIEATGADFSSGFDL